MMNQSKVEEMAVALYFDQYRKLFKRKDILDFLSHKEPHDFECLKTWLVKREQNFEGKVPSLMAEAERYEEEGIHLTELGAEDYPEGLGMIPQSPLYLWWKGRSPAAMNLKNTLAIVGSREASPYGERLCQEILHNCALSYAQLQHKQSYSESLWIVSGLALGIDSLAHRAALDEGLATAAILPIGLEKVYPAQHEDLARRILEADGCLCSELAPNSLLNRRYFASRNRLISGLAKALLVIEAGSRSGTLITAGFAFEQDRPVYAVPGSVYWSSSRGCLELIKQGANLLSDRSDVEQMLTDPLAALQQFPRMNQIAVEEEAPDSDPILTYVDQCRPDFDTFREHFQLNSRAAAMSISAYERKGLLYWRYGELFLTVSGFSAIYGK